MKQFRHTVLALLLLSSASSFAATNAPTDQSNAPTPVMAAANITEDPSASSSKEGRLWNLQDADILSVINEVSLETGKNFVVDPRVSGKITLVSSKPIKPSEVYQVFLSVLGMIGYSAVPAGNNVVKIIPNMESGENATKVVNRLAPGRGDEVVVRVIPLDNVSANQLIPIVRPLLPQWSNVSAYVPGNVLILLGRAANLQRIVNIIRDIDQTSSSNIEVVKLHQASASQLVTVLNNLQNASRATGDSPQVSIAADERSNSILLSGNKSARLHMRFLITRLDTPSNGAQGNTEVIYLRYLQAAKFAPILGKIAQNMLGKDTGKEIASVTVTPASSTTATNSANKTPENQTTIQAEPNTNALIITAPPTLMTALNSIVAKLDIRPAQVLVEGIIVEVNQSDIKNMGIQWGSLESAAPIPTPTVPSDFPIPNAGNVGIIPNTSITAILNMLESQSGTNILSTPSIAVLDNQKAILEIGQEVPIQTGSYATTGGTNTVTPFNTITTKPVTLKLQVIPQINLGDAVRLLINLKNDSLQNPNAPGLTPIINTSSIQNAVIINSSDVLVLGGLISNNVNETINKVPILGDIPMVGLLFQHKDRQVQKKNLLVFLKPTILRNPDDYTTITQTKYNNVRKAELAFPEDLNKLPAKAPFVLPPWKNNTELPKPFETE